VPIVKNTINKSILKMSKKLNNVPKQAFDYWVKITPKNTGNARRKTKFVKKNIVARYEYASYLDKGSSKKAPRGMSKPVKEFIDKLIKRIMRK